MEQMITANISLDIFSIVLSMIPIIYLLNNQRYKQKINRYFLYICIFNVFMIIGDLGDWILRDALNQSQIYLLLASATLFYVASAFVLYFFARYMDAYLNLTTIMRKWFLTSVILLCGIQIIFALVSPFTGSIFYATSEGYVRGELFMISQFVPFCCYLLFTCLVIIHRKHLTSREVIFFLLYIFVPLGGGATQMFLRGIAVVNIGVALALLFILVNIQFERELLIEKQEQELLDMHVNIMLSQIQPHFLYNTLTTIRQLCDIDPSLAKECISDFSYFLRCNMNSLKSKAPIAFEQELRHTIYYLKLEQQRFHDRLTVKIETPVTDFSIPSLTLQPLVENAVRHGLMMKDEGGTLTIQTKETANAYIITITDDGIGFDLEAIEHDGKIHIGMQNVRERLKTMIGADLKIISILEKGTTAIITIDKEEAT